MKRSHVLAVTLSLGVASGIAGAFLFHGCRAIESTGDALAGATSGTPLSSVFGGVARMAESLRDYSPAEEHYIGRSVSAQILARYKVHPDKKLQEYVNLVGLAVLAAPEPKKTLTGYHFIVLEGKEVQAVSAPGGFIFLTEGTIRKARDEDELAAVLAHEIAHVSLNHGIGAISAATRNKSIALLVQGVGQTGAAVAGAGGDTETQQLAELAAAFGDAIQDITGQLLEKGYSRDLEIEADKTAAKYMESSGYSRGALTTYLQALEKGGEGGKGGWFATHPTPEDRVETLQGEGLAGGTTAGRDVRRERFAGSLGA
jgi:predicted Zn-dependent protease